MEMIKLGINLFIAFLFYFILMKVWMIIARRVGEMLHIGELICKLFRMDSDDSESK